MSTASSDSKQAAPANAAGRALFWIKATRIEFITGSIVPVLVGGAVAWHLEGQLMWGYWIATLLGVALLHSAANLANDYYDHLSGNDEANSEFIRPFTGGSRVIQKGTASARSILIASLVCLVAGAAIGMVLVWFRGWPILALGVIGGLSGFFYTARPLQLGYRGLGELFIFLDFGLLPVIGTCYVQTGRFDPESAMASVPVGLLIAAVLWINQFADYEADRAVDKRHWVVRLGRRRAAWVYAAMVVGALAAAPVGVVAGLMPAWTQLLLLLTPLAGFAIVTAVRHYDEPQALLPANISTIIMHSASGILIALGFVLG